MPLKLDNYHQVLKIQSRHDGSYFSTWWSSMWGSISYTLNAYCVICNFRMYILSVACILKQQVMLYLLAKYPRLRIVKCSNISHHSHIRYDTYQIYHFDHAVHENMYVCGSDDWYSSIWHVSMSLEFYWPLSNWVEPLYVLKSNKPFLRGEQDC